MRKQILSYLHELVRDRQLPTLLVDFGNGGVGQTQEAVTKGDAEGPRLGRLGAHSNSLYEEGGPEMRGWVREGLGNPNGRAR